MTPPERDSQTLKTAQHLWSHTRPVRGVVVQHCNRDCEGLSNVPLLTVELWTGI